MAAVDGYRIFSELAQDILPSRRGGVSFWAAVAADLAASAYQMQQQQQ